MDSSLIPPPPDYANVPSPPDAVGPLNPVPERTGLARVLLGQPGSGPRGGATVPAILARALGAEDPTAEKVGQFGQGLQRSLAMPWAPGAGAGAMGIRALQSAGLGAAEGVSKGESLPEIGTRAAVGGVLSPMGDIAAKGVRSVLGVAPHKLYSGKTGEQLAEWLRSNVPAWADMKGKRALYEMAREGGQAKLSDAYEQALMAAVGKIKEGTTVNVPTAIAARAGFTGAKDVADRMGQVAVDAQRLLTLLPTLTKDQTTRRAVLDALHAGLPEGIVPSAAMNAYKTGAGWMDFAKKAGLFKKGEEYSAHAAQQGLRTVGKETLERRGMEGARKIIRGPLGKPPIEKGTAQGIGTALGALGGALGGGSFSPGAGAVGASGGALGGGFLGGRLPIYKNVPEVLPQIRQLRQALMQALTQGGISAMKSTGE